VSVYLDRLLDLKLREKMDPLKHMISAHGRIRYEVDSERGCWNWKMATGIPSGKYIRGYLRVNKKDYIAHRWIYEQYKGKIPEGHDLHHKCENTLCVNPDHMEPKLESEHIRFHRLGEIRSMDQKMNSIKFSRTKTKLSSEQVGEMLKMRKEGYSYSKLVEHFGVAMGTVYRLCSKGGYAVERYFGERV
jgi:hypothetical protein